MSHASACAELENHGIHAWGSEGLKQFENHMARYFEREYLRWQDKQGQPEDHGVSSFAGSMTSNVTRGDLMEQHYDDELRVFSAFLDKDYMAYTMAYYGENSEQVRRSGLTLEQAQKNKYRLVAERAQVEDGQTILDLGCGFGGLSAYLLEHYPNVEVTGVNPSQVQTDYIRDCLRQADHPLDARRFTLLQAFFDEVGNEQLAKKKFDRVISLGMLEHISNMDALFAQIAPLLATGGKSFHHCIVSIPTVPRLLDAADTLIGRYFPGGHVWPYAEPVRHSNHLQPLDSWFVNGMNYWATLDDWHRRFWNAIDQLYPAVIDRRQVDDWNRYFSLCKAMFIPCEGTLYGNGHYLYGL